MGFLDDVGAFTKGISQKAKGNLDVVSLSAQKMGLERDMDRLYRDLGEAYFAGHKEPQAENESVAPLIQALLEKEAELKGMLDKIEQTREETAAVQMTAPNKAAPNATVPNAAAPMGSGRKCFNCGAELVGDALFCSNCGARQDEQPRQPAEEPKAAENVCPNCQSVLPEGAVFCANCGTKLS